MPGIAKTIPNTQCCGGGTPTPPVPGTQIRLYADGTAGNDSWDGSQWTPAPGNVGPFRTLQKLHSVAEGLVEVADGIDVICYVRHTFGEDWIWTEETHGTSRIHFVHPIDQHTVSTSGNLVAVGGETLPAPWAALSVAHDLERIEVDFPVDASMLGKTVRIASTVTIDSACFTVLKQKTVGLQYYLWITARKNSLPAWVGANPATVEILLPDVFVPKVNLTSTLVMPFGDTTTYPNVEEPLNWIFGIACDELVGVEHALGFAACVVTNRLAAGSNLDASLRYRRDTSSGFEYGLSDALAEEWGIFTGTAWDGHTLGNSASFIFGAQGAMNFSGYSQQFLFMVGVAQGDLDLFSAGVLFAAYGATPTAYHGIIRGEAGFGCLAVASGSALDCGDLAFENSQPNIAAIQTFAGGELSVNGRMSMAEASVTPVFGLFCYGGVVNWSSGIQDDFRADQYKWVIDHNGDAELSAGGQPFAWDSTTANATPCIDLSVGAGRCVIEGNVRQQAPNSVGNAAPFLYVAFGGTLEQRNGSFALPPGITDWSASYGLLGALTVRGEARLGPLSGGSAAPLAVNVGAYVQQGGRLLHQGGGLVGVAPLLLGVEPVARAWPAGVLTDRLPVWDDFVGPPLALQTGGTTGLQPPTLDRFRRDGAGTSIGVWTYRFNRNANPREMVWVAQIPHRVKKGSQLLLHVHYSPGITGQDAGSGSVGSGKQINWRAEVSVANVLQTFPVTQTVIMDSIIPVHIPAQEPLHCISPEISIVLPVAVEPSTIVFIRIYRESASEGVNGFASDYAWFLGIDAHFQTEREGTMASGGVGEVTSYDRSLSMVNPAA